MPSVIGAWCKQLGHKVHYILYGGRSNLIKQIPEELDLVFISSFTFTAHLAYSLSNLLRSKGIVTVLGGPHARSYPQDSCKYFDYVVGLIDKDLLNDIISDCTQNQTSGIFLTGEKHLKSIPSVEERWEFIEIGFKHSPLIKLIPMLSSIGCPYNCDFCVDSTVPYEALNSDSIKKDFQFALSKFKRPRIGWYDPNFAVRFESIMEAIEESDPQRKIDFIAECNLSTLTETNVKRLRKNGFDTILPGIESWFAFDKKVGSVGIQGYEKVKQISEQVNMIHRIIPLVNVNFMFGLDSDQGPEPFELTKKFIDLTPGVYPVFVLLGVFGQAPPCNIKYQRENRIIPIPFHFHRSVHFINIKPKNYSWIEFYDYLIDMIKYCFSKRALYRRFISMKNGIPRWLILAQSASTGGFAKISHHSEVTLRLRTDQPFRRFFEQETLEIPDFFKERIKMDLGPELWSWLPKDSLEHDPNAYYESLT